MVYKPGGWVASHLAALRAPSAKIRSTDVVSITVNLRRLRDDVSGHESDRSAVTVEDDDDVKDGDDAGAGSASESESWLEDA